MNSSRHLKKVKTYYAKMYGFVCAQNNMYIFIRKFVRFEVPLEVIKLVHRSLSFLDYPANNLSKLVSYECFRL